MIGPAFQKTVEARSRVRLFVVVGAVFAWFSNAVITDVSAQTVDRSEPPRFMVLEIEPSRVGVGETAELHWSVWNADEVKLGRDNPRSMPPNGSIRITPTRGGDRTFELYAVNGAGLEATESIVLEVPAAEGVPQDGRPLSGPAEIRSLEATPMRVEANQPVTITWDTRNAQKVFFGTRVGMAKPLAVAASGSERLSPAETTTYHLVALGADGRRVERSVTVQVGAMPAPQILSFSASPTQVKPGQAATFSWTTEGAEKVILGGQNRAVAASGRVSIQFNKSAMVRLVAVGSDGQTTERTVRISVAQPKPSIAVFEVDRPTVVFRQNARLTWRVQDADSVQLTLLGKGTRTIGPQGSAKISGRKAGTLHYRLTATNRQGTTHKDVTIRVLSAGEADCEKC